MDLRIEAPEKDLEELRVMLEAEAPAADVQGVSAMHPGQLGEPVLVSLVVDLGGPALVAGAVKVFDRWMQHREAMAREQTIRLALLGPDSTRPVSVEEARLLLKGGTLRPSAAEK